MLRIKLNYVSKRGPWKQELINLIPNMSLEILTLNQVISV